MKPTAHMATQEINVFLNQLPPIGTTHWVLQNGKLHLALRFANFVEAFAAMTAIALQAEKLNHHPDWTNSYNQLDIFLSTHEAGGITEKDFELARAITQVLNSPMAPGGQP